MSEPFLVRCINDEGVKDRIVEVGKIYECFGYKGENIMVISVGLNRYPIKAARFVRLREDENPHGAGNYRLP